MVEINPQTYRNIHRQEQYVKGNRHMQTVNTLNKNDLVEILANVFRTDKNNVYIYTIE